MRQKIDYSCDACGHIGLKKKNWKTRIFGTIKILFLSFFILTSLIGLSSLANFVNLAVYENSENIVSIGGTYAFVVNVFKDYRYSDEIEKLTIFSDEIVRNCEDDVCKARKIYENLLTFDYQYEDATDLNPWNTWNAKKGDCDMMSMLLISMLSTENIDIDSKMECTITHCWVVIFLDDQKIKADITKQEWRENYG